MLSNQQIQQLEQQLIAGLAQIQVQASQVQIQQLIEYLQLLVKWNKAYNLTAVRDPQEMLYRHLFDSLVVLPYVQGQDLTDVGSGAGLPSIPLAIMRPDMQVLSLDSNGKKTRFQFQVKTQLKLDNFAVQQVRVEQLTTAVKSNQIISRAFASLQDFIVLTQNWAAPAARWLAMKGHYPQAELNNLPPGYQCQHSYTLHYPGQDGHRHLVVIERQAERKN